MMLCSEFNPIKTTFTLPSDNYIVVYCLLWIIIYIAVIGKGELIASVDMKMIAMTFVEVKVESWNVISACRTLQLQIVWKWLRVLVLSGRLIAIRSIYLLKTTKFSSYTEKGN